jgi:hypothetical protein
MFSLSFPFSICYNDKIIIPGYSHALWRGVCSERISSAASRRIRVRSSKHPLDLIAGLSKSSMVSELKRIPCGYDGCPKDYSDPASVTKHRQKAHGKPGRRRATVGTSDGATGTSSAKPKRTREHSQCFRDVLTNCLPLDKKIKQEHQAIAAEHGLAECCCKGCLKLAPPKGRQRKGPRGEASLLPFFLKMPTYTPESVVGSVVEGRPDPPPKNFRIPPLFD